MIVDHSEFRAEDAREAAIARRALIEETLWLWVNDPDTVKFHKHSETGTRRLLDGLRVCTDEENNGSLAWSY